MMVVCRLAVGIVKLSGNHFTVSNMLILDVAWCHILWHLKYSIARPR